MSRCNDEDSEECPLDQRDWGLSPPEDGKDGKDGKDGENGKDGRDGKDGGLKWYWRITILILATTSCVSAFKFDELKKRVEVLEKNQKAESGK